MTKTILELKNIHRHFKQGGKDLHILRGIDLSLKEGEMVGLVGASGTGKSTLLQIAGLLDRLDQGEVMLDGLSSAGLSDRKRTHIRRNDIGFVYQFHHLLPEFSALENVALPRIVAGLSKGAASVKAKSLLEKMGLGERLDHRPSALSGGEQQRVAIARALINDPKILLADEPTGNLDEATGQRILDILLGLAKENGIAALIATHNSALADNMDRCVLLTEGRLVKG